MAYTSSLHLSKHLLLPKAHRGRHPSSRSPSFVPAARVNGAPHVNGKASKSPNGKVQINGGDGKKSGVVNGRGKKVPPGVLNGKPPSPVELPADADAKTSMVVAHRGGSMAVVLKVLSAFSSRGINMSKLEIINNEGAGGAGELRPPVMILDTGARGAPTLRSFPHVLYVDCEGAADDPLVRDAIKEIEKFAVFVRILGCYAADTNVYDLQ